MYEINLFRPQKVSKKQLADFLRQFSHLIRAKLNANDAVKILITQIDNRLFSNMLSDVHFEMLKGRPLSDCLFGQKILPPLVSKMIGVGERSGNLFAVLHTLSTLYEKEAAVENSIKNSLLYPVIVVVVMIISVFVSVAYIVPQFANLFSVYESDLPLPSRILMDTGLFVNENLLLIILGLVIFILCFLLFIQSEGGRSLLDKALLTIPIINKYTKLGQNAQFAMTLSVCLNAGMVSSDALLTSKTVLTNTVLKKDAEQLLLSISKGQLMSDAFSKSAYILPILTNMVRLGESSGDLQTAINDAAFVIYDEFDRHTKDALKLLEPALTIAVGLMVAFVMAAIVLPTLNLSAII